eukprot:CAMPEP_0168734172 /NCGR_PEP_ID=MMETSP0724-20121128/8674_1 /TAXON_ID=265536 /ORGANISM="Amphiprora sp., Strain CCMP467" /LENGTH=87 /DNA_ID=CAMNT_0008781263 /DNA_START=182 /DNA_END=445 /DNA_ORIENTATION=+
MTESYDESLTWFDYEPSQPPSLVPEHLTHLRIGFAAVPAIPVGSQVPSIEAIHWSKGELCPLLAADPCTPSQLGPNKDVIPALLSRA